MKDHTFTVDNVEYEIKVGLSGQNKIIVQAFKANTNEAANGFQYSINLNMAIDMENVQGVSGVQELIEIAKNDVINKRWEELEEILKSIPTNLKTDSGFNGNKFSNQRIHSIAGSARSE